MAPETELEKTMPNAAPENMKVPAVDFSSVGIHLEIKTLADGYKTPDARPIANLTPMKALSPPCHIAKGDRAFSIADSKAEGVFSAEFFRYQARGDVGDDVAPVERGK